MWSVCTHSHPCAGIDVGAVMGKKSKSSGSSKGAEKEEKKKRKARDEEEDEEEEVGRPAAQFVGCLHLK